jgi:hypothetical protein
MNRDTYRQIVVILSVAITLAINALANIIPLNNLTTAEISDSFQVLFVPAGYVFAIWGVIYLGLVVFAVYQALPQHKTDPVMRKVGYPFALSGVANSVWIFLWHYQYFLLTLVAMLSLLVLLIYIYLRLEIGQKPVKLIERWMVQIPISIYLGWISVATIANISDVLDYLGWDGGGIQAATWTVIMLAVALVLGVVISLTRRDVFFVLVLAWAFVGIAVKQASIQEVAVGSWIAAGLSAVLAVANLIGSFRRPLWHQSKA